MSLSSLVAAQRNEELARLVESSSRITLALEAGREEAGYREWRTATATVMASASYTVRRAVAALRLRLAQSLDAHASRADARARTAPSGPDSQLVCCA